MNDNNTITTVKKALETSGFTAKMIKKIFAVHEILAKDEDSLQIHDKTSIIDAFAIISSILLMAGIEVKYSPFDASSEKIDFLPFLDAGEIEDLGELVLEALKTMNAIHGAGVETRGRGARIQKADKIIKGIMKTGVVGLDAMFDGSFKIPEQAPGIPEQAPGIPEQAPGIPEQAPGVKEIPEYVPESKIEKEFKKTETGADLIARIPMQKADIVELCAKSSVHEVCPYRVAGSSVETGALVERRVPHLVYIDFTHLHTYHHDKQKQALRDNPYHEVLNSDHFMAQVLEKIVDCLKLASSEFAFSFDIKKHKFFAFYSIKGLDFLKKIPRKTGEPDLDYLISNIEWIGVDGFKFKNGEISGEQIDVDTWLVKKMVVDVIRDYKGDVSTIHLFSGDKDMEPAVQSALDEGIRVAVTSYNDSIAHRWWEIGQELVDARHAGRIIVIDLLNVVRMLRPAPRLPKKKPPRHRYIP